MCRTEKQQMRQFKGVLTVSPAFQSLQPKGRGDALQELVRPAAAWAISRTHQGARTPLPWQKKSLVTWFETFKLKTCLFLSTLVSPSVWCEWCNESNFAVPLSKAVIWNMPGITSCKRKYMFCFPFTYVCVFQPFKLHWVMFTTFFFGLDAFSCILFFLSCVWLGTEKINKQRKNTLKTPGIN